MKLWFFRTPKGIYGKSMHRMRLGDMVILDGGFRFTGVMDCGRRRPRQWHKEVPPLKPGACIPVELVPAKKKKVRKG